MDVNDGGVDADAAAGAGALDGGRDGRGKWRAGDSGVGAVPGAGNV